jgi:ectoine hydroxylase-related dioxygenase (phytanoyl-CoA dioxygenase family)
MLTVDCKTDPDWLPLTLEALRHQGVAVVTGVLAAGFLEETRARMYAVQRRIRAEVGEARLERAGEVGVLRLMMKHDRHFCRLLEVPETLQVVDAALSDAAILHLQNGFILPSSPPGQCPKVFQTRYHMDFPRVLNGCVMSLNLLFAIDPFTPANGATLVVPGTHQRAVPPAAAFLEAAAVAAVCPAGSMLVFDSTLWHAAGANTSGGDRLAINHQYTRSYVKQQVDYVRALGDAAVLELPPRTQQLLGWYTRVVTSLDEYYRPADQRLYRAGQG